MVFPFADKGTLQEWIRKEKPLQKEKLRISKDIVSALRYLEGIRIIHRDLAARNVLVKEQHVIISDLGMSRKNNKDFYKSTAKKYHCDGLHLSRCSTANILINLMSGALVS